MLTATPYNKTYLDLANQLRLFIPEDEDIVLNRDPHVHLKHLKSQPQIEETAAHCRARPGNANRACMWAPRAGRFSYF